MSNSFFKYAAAPDPLLNRKVRSASRSVIGRRKHNEDRCYRSDDNGFYLVVDGMGGHAGGALASQIAVETIPLAFRSNHLGNILDEKYLTSAIQHAVEDASGEMRSVGESFPDYNAMGCTLAAAFVDDQNLYFANVGDCRVYHFHKGDLEQLTSDETLVNQLHDAGMLRSAELETHRWRHVVTNSVSAKGIQTAPEMRAVKLDAADRILLTSDGLTNEMSEREIEQILRDCLSPEECVNALIALAEHRETRDNASCVVIDV